MLYYLDNATLVCVCVTKKALLGAQESTEQWNVDSDLV